jgi:acyl dehydratase
MPSGRYPARMSHAPRPIKHWWEDFPVGSVHVYGPLTVKREETIAFATAFDPQPFHLDEAAAEASLFKRLSASGWHTCAMTMRMLCDAYLMDSSSLGSPGLEMIKWHLPVYPGDVLSGRTTVLESRPMNSKPEVGLLKLRYETCNQDGVAVMTMEGWGMMRRRGM